MNYETLHLSKINEEIKKGGCINFKNYAVLCNFLDIENHGGNYKENVKKNLNKYFEVTYEGRKISVIKKKENIAEENNKIKIGSNAKYAKELVPVLNYLFKEKICYYSKTELLLTSNMINYNFMYYKYKKKKLLNTLKTRNYKLVIFFYEIFLKKYYPILKKSLGILEKHKIIKINEVFYLSRHKSDKTPRLANESETITLEKAEQDIFNDLGVNNIQQIYANHHDITYRLRMNQVAEGISGYENVYRIYKIENICDKFKEDEAKVNEYKKNLNDKVVKGMKKELVKLQKKAQMTQKDIDDFNNLINLLILDKNLTN